MNKKTANLLNEKDEKKSKYKNEKVIRNNIAFDSKAEADYYDFLLLSYSPERIILQPKFELLPGFVKFGKKQNVMTYKADFKIDNVVYDVKGFETEAFKLKKKLFNYMFEDLELVLVFRKGKSWIQK